MKKNLLLRLLCIILTYMIVASGTPVYCVQVKYLGTHELLGYTAGMYCKWHPITINHYVKRNGNLPKLVIIEGPTYNPPKFTDGIGDELHIKCIYARQSLIKDTQKTLSKINQKPLNPHFQLIKKNLGLIQL